MLYRGTNRRGTLRPSPEYHKIVNGCTYITVYLIRMKNCPLLFINLCVMYVLDNSSADDVYIYMQTFRHNWTVVRIPTQLCCDTHTNIDGTFSDRARYILLPTI